jgi:CheY-like chemotaxis protein
VKPRAAAPGTERDIDAWSNRNFALSSVWSVRALAVAKTQTEKLTTLAVLVAEDEPTVRALAESIIADLGCSTFSAANAREALAVLENGTPITLLFTDINMPDGPDGLDGLELGQRAVEIRPDLRVIYTTGGGLTDGMTALFVDGGTFLPKPFTREQLIAAIRGDSEAASSPAHRTL